MWKFVADHSLKCSQESFCSALQIWILKPHTVNRRLIGSRQTECDSTLPSSFHNGRALELQDSLPIATGGSCEREVRELIPKQLGRFHTAIELIVSAKQRDFVSFAFIPLIHADSSGEKAHLDNTLAYSIAFNSATSTLVLHVSTNNEEAVCTSLGVSEEWLQLVLLPRILRWCEQTNLDTDVKSLNLVPIDTYTLKYQELKQKYGLELVQNWTEGTDPRKFVYEDISIAAYLIVLWEEQRRQTGQENKQSFVDLGCGNGLLVYLLSEEGYPGIGIDIRKRQIWDKFGPDTVLYERSITPSDECLFPDYDWILGNHSDELTPWIPVIAAKSSVNCNFFLLPCCPWDFTAKFSTKKSGMSVYQNYLNYVADVIDVCGFCVEKDTLRIPSTKRVCFVGRERNYNTDGEATAIDSASVPSDSTAALCGRIQRFIDSRKEIVEKSISCKTQHPNGKTRANGSTFHNGSTFPNGSTQTRPCSCQASDAALCDEADDKTAGAVDKDSASAVRHCDACQSLQSDDVMCSNHASKSTDCAHAKDTVDALNSASSHTMSTQVAIASRAELWTSGFVARQQADEASSHCVNLVDELKHRIVRVVYTELLGKVCLESESQLTGNRWRRGGKLPMSDVVQLFDQETMTQLKNECGGLQTLLKNHHHVFMVQGGHVQLRDWTKHAEFDDFQLQKKKRKGLSEQQIKATAARLWKTQLCYNHLHHPDGCPLETQVCRFAHGNEELRQLTQQLTVQT